MIVLDIETSGGNPVDHGIWQIGAVELENPKNTFLQEGRIDDEDLIEKESLLITGKTEKELREKNKQSQKQLIKNFLEWIKKYKNRDLICHNPQFDISFIKGKAIKYWKQDPFWIDKIHRAFDIHTIAQMKFHEIKNKFLTEEHHSDMGLGEILELCGLKDNRIDVEDGKITKKGKPHNALEDAKLTAECFSRIVYRKNLFPEYVQFKIPDYLKK